MLVKKRKVSYGLIRVVVAAVLFAAFFAVYHFAELNRYINLALFMALYLFIGGDVAWKAIKGLFRGHVMDENLLMFIASAGAFVVGEYPEAVAVMLFYQVGELFQGYAVRKSRASIASLMDIRPDTATVLREGKEIVVSPEEVKTGEIIVVRPGERIPLDGTVIEGVSTLNMTALTGESLPKDVCAGDSAVSGALNLSGLIKIRCEKEYGESTVARILDLVENASAKKAKAESFISRFSAVYTPVVVLAALILGVLPPLIIAYNDWSVWSDWIYRALTFLVVSCPCALVLSVPLSFFGAIGGSAKAGILIKGGNYFEILDKTDTVILDKTGTVTEGSFAVKQVIPQDKRDEILSAAAVAEKNSLHPVAKSVSAAAPKVESEGYAVTEKAGMGVIAQKEDDVIAVGNEKLMRSLNVDFVPGDEEGTIVYVARNGKYLGRIVIGDTVKKDSAAAIKELRANGVKTVMLTGDNEQTAASVAAEVGVDEYKSELLPQDKVTQTEKYLGRKNKTAFVGDGINDAPVLMRADVGVAMGGIGSDCAIEAADVVLMHDNLSSFLKAKRIAKKTMRIVRENIVFSLGVKAAVLILSALGLAGMWLAVFADVGVAVIAVLNAMRMLRAHKL